MLHVVTEIDNIRLSLTELNLERDQESNRGVKGNMTDPMTQALMVKTDPFWFQIVTCDITIFTRMQDNSILKQQTHSPLPPPPPPQKKNPVREKCIYPNLRQHPQK
jgi:hypothetical protein